MEDTKARRGTRSGSKKIQFEACLYKDIEPTWPKHGKHILAQYDDEVILVYQAYKPSIGHYAAKNKKFEGAPGWKVGRMTWIKTNFLWMMYRSGWGTKKDQEVTLGIWLKREFFEEIIRAACATTFSPKRHATKEEWQAEMAKTEVRIQWDPDHLPDGQKAQRRAIQLGMKKGIQERFASGDHIVDIVDLSDFVAQSNRIEVAKERIYVIEDKDLAAKVGLSTGEEGKEGEEESNEGD